MHNCLMISQALINCLSVSLIAISSDSVLDKDVNFCLLDDGVMKLSPAIIT